MKGRDRILVVGDAILDRDVDGHAERLCPEQPVPVVDEQTTRSSPGGAALAAALLARDGRDVCLLTAVAHDEPGCELLDLLADTGVTVVNVGLDGSTREKIRLRSGEHLFCRVDRGGGAPRPTDVGLPRRLVREARAVLVSDYGAGLTGILALRAALAEAGCLVWDPHPRGADPLPAAAVVTPNEREARLLVGEGDPTDLALRLLARWQARAVCVTCGSRGAELASDRYASMSFPVVPAQGDPCGAGDRFATAVTALLAERVALPEAIGAACGEASAFIAGGGWHGGASPPPADDDAVALVERVRARGGTVVATGGCFDLLHAGHIAMLESARRLGDCLVVCLNSDLSVRKVKGPGRPLVGEDDRAAVLRGLAAVDAVVLFDDDTPCGILRRLRPDVWVKGADYEARELPEAAVMAELGGRVVTVPYVAGHSTTGLIERAVGRVRAA